MGAAHAWARRGALIVAGLVLCAGPGVACADVADSAGALAAQPPGAAPQDARGASADDASDGPEASDAAPETLPTWPRDAEPLLKALVAGTWPLAEGQDFADDHFGGEAELRVAYTRRRAGQTRRMWAGLRTEGDSLGVGTYFDSHDKREGASFCYVYALVQRDIPDALLPETVIAPQQAVLHVRHRGRLRAWLDGQLVLDEPAPPAGSVGQASAPVTLTDAFDVLLLKLGRGDGLGETFDVEVRVATPDGAPVEHFLWNTMRPSHLPPDLPPESLR